MQLFPMPYCSVCRLPAQKTSVSTPTWKSVPHMENAVYWLLWFTQFVLSFQSLIYVFYVLGGG